MPERCHCLLFELALFLLFLLLSEPSRSFETLAGLNLFFWLPRYAPRTASHCAPHSLLAPPGRQVGIRLGAGHTVNVPWRREGMGDAEYLTAFDALLMPIARAFDPELVLVSAGFDAASGDRVGGMALTAEAFAGMTARLGTLAAGKLVLALEGGYRPALAAKGLLACARVLLGDPAVGPAARPPPLGTEPSLDGIARSAHRVLLEVRLPLRHTASHPTHPPPRVVPSVRRDRDGAARRPNLACVAGPPRMAVHARKPS